ncbi:MAG: hypothetical protein WD295_03600, partial [Bacteroidota bacterium]
MNTLSIVGFFLHALGWITPLALLAFLGFRAADPGEPVGLKRILFGGTLIVLSLLFSLFWLRASPMPALEYTLVSQGVILAGLIIVFDAARRIVPALLTGPPTPAVHRENTPVRVLLVVLP